MRLIQTGQKFSFNYTAYDQDSALNVAFSIYDVTTGTAVFLTKIVSSYAASGAYTGTYTGAADKTYLIIGVVYTDNTYLTVDTSRAVSSDIYQSLQNSVSYLAFAYPSYDFSSSLHLRAAVYNLTTGTPVFVQNVSIAYVDLGVYFGHFTGVVGDTYNIASVVYTTTGFSTPDFDYAPSVDEFDCITLTDNMFVYGQANLVGQNLNAFLQGE